MTPMGSVRACGSVNTLCGTRDGYYAGNLIVGENMGVTGNININGSIKEVQDMSVLRALNVNGMAKLESVNLRSGEDLRVIGDATVQKMTVEGDTHVGGTLAVDKHVNMKGDAEVHGDMRGMKGVDVNNGVRVGKTFHVKGDVFLNKSCMHEDDLYTMGSAGAMGDMLAGKNLGTGKDHIVAGSGVVAGSTMVGRNLDVADNMDVLTNVSIGGDLNVSQGANLKGNVSLIGPGGSVYVTGGSVLLGEGRKGATPPDTRGVHVRRLNGKTTSFCVDKHNVIDGDTILHDDICWGEGNNLCLNDPKTVHLLNLENFLSTSISNAERVIRNDRELRTSGAHSLFVRASNDMSSHENVFSSDTKNLDEFDRRARSDLTSHGKKQELQKLAIVRVDNKNKVQESRLTRLEALLKRVEVRAFNILKDSATNACAKKTSQEPKKAKITLFQNKNYGGVRFHKNFKIMDRMMFRTRGKVVASESWHRDEAPEAADEDDVFGGWINLDDTDHHFSCIPGSHKGVSKHSGFGKEKVVDSANKEKIRVPPSHIIIFFERILHEVNRSNVPPKGIVRLFLGWRLTNSTRSLYDLKDIFMNQAVPKLKSDQTPAMYSIYHRNVWVDALESFSATFKENCIVKDNLKGRDVKIVPMHMKSLRSIGVPMYKEYTSRECLLYVPGKRWDLEVPCSETSRVDTLEF
eukprot:gene23483-biopygen11158